MQLLTIYYNKYRYLLFRYWNMAILSERKKEIIVNFGGDPKNTGCTDVQIAILTEKINELTLHVKANKKDYASKRSLYHLVAQRRHLLKYLKINNNEKYIALVKKLKLRG